MGETISAPFKSSFTGIYNEKPIAEIIELDLPVWSKRIFKSEEILRLKLIFINADQRAYSTWFMMDFFEMHSVAEIHLKNKVKIIGHITGFHITLEILKPLLMYFHMMVRGMKLTTAILKV
ncbi:MAG TPA: hypothetical protein VF610_01660 [Segetibacter sp.]|jgi:hypothetical protein